MRYIGIENRILKLADEFGMMDRIWFSSFSRISIEKIHLLRPDAKVGFLYSEKSALMPSYAGILGLTALHPAFYNLISLRFMEDCRKNGLLVNMWTIDTPEQMRICFRAGVHAVITNYPDRARKILEEMRENSR